MKRVYISGPITGVDDYKNVFNTAEKSIEAMGYEVVNPARVDIECLSWDEYMEIDLALLSMCDITVMLDGWKKSTGACIERGFALGRKMLVFDSMYDLMVFVPQGDKKC